MNLVLYTIFRVYVNVFQPEIFVSVSYFYLHCEANHIISINRSSYSSSIKKANTALYKPINRNKQSPARALWHTTSKTLARANIMQHLPANKHCQFMLGSRAQPTDSWHANWYRPQKVGRVCQSSFIKINKSIRSPAERRFEGWLFLRLRFARPPSWKMENFVKISDFLQFLWYSAMFSDVLVK